MVEWVLYFICAVPLTALTLLILLCPFFFVSKTLLKGIKWLFSPKERYDG